MIYPMRRFYALAKILTTRISIPKLRPKLKPKKPIWTTKLVKDTPKNEETVRRHQEHRLHKTQ